MTDAVEASAAEQLPDDQYLTFIKGRGIVFRHVTPAQGMVLGGILRRMNGDGNTVENILDAFGKLMALIETLIVNREDLTWLEDQILAGAVDFEDFGTVFRSFPRSEEAPAKKRPRRAR